MLTAEALLPWQARDILSGLAGDLSPAVGPYQALSVVSSYLPGMDNWPYPGRVLWRPLGSIL